MSAVLSLEDDALFCSAVLKTRDHIFTLKRCGLCRELNDNHLTGRIPPELGKLTDLFDL